MNIKLKIFTWGWIIPKIKKGKTKNKSIRKALNTWLLIINNRTGVSIPIKIKSKLNNHCSILNFYITVFIFSNID